MKEDLDQENYQKVSRIDDTIQTEVNNLEYQIRLHT